MQIEMNCVEIPGEKTASLDRSSNFKVFCTIISKDLEFGKVEGE